MLSHQECLPSWPGMSRIRGKWPYSVKFGRGKSGHYDLTLDSTLAGLALNFPAPLKKTAGQTLPLHVTWAPRAGAMALSATLGKTISALFIHRATKAPGPFFASGFVGVGRETHLLAKGKNIDVQYPEIDIAQ